MATGMRVLAKVAAACFVVALPVLFVTSNVRILASDAGFYESGLRKHDADRATGIALTELDRSAQEIIEYFENDAETLRIVVSENGQEAPLFNAREVEHMRDVKSLVRLVYRVNEISLAFVLAYVTGVFLWARERPLRELAWLALGGVGAGVVVLGAVGALAITGFDSAWTQFHELAFSNDLWQLDPDTDHLIQMFPEKFWEEATLTVGVMAIAEAVATAALATGYLLIARQQGGDDRERARAGPGS
ncbi:TIGR01906 family membrane protein [bacterium]|nr:MAG: TIGR01906 family membrane protein [bacterium]